MIPVGGTVIVWVPVALYLVLNGAVIKGIILIGVGAGSIVLIGNVLQPFLIGGQARLPLFPLYLASFGGLAYFGFLGLLLGPIILAVVLETFVIYQEEYQQGGNDVIMGVATDPHADLRTARGLADKPL